MVVAADAQLACGHLRHSARERVHGTVELIDGKHHPLVFRVCARCYLNTIANLCETGDAKGGPP